MKQPPAFQFYVDNFIEGTIEMTDAELGLYIRLLCAQWSRSGLPNDDAELKRFSRGQPPAQLNRSMARVKSKFIVSESGSLINERLEVERIKQVEYRIKQAQNGSMGGRPAKPTANPSLSQKQSQSEPKNSSPSPSPSPLLEREREFPEIPPMSRKDYDSLADLRGIPKDCAEWFWNACDGRNWTDKHGQPIRKVEPLLINAAKNWRAIETSRKQTNGKWQKPEQTVDDILKKLL